MQSNPSTSFFLLIALWLGATCCTGNSTASDTEQQIQQSDQWVTYAGGDGPGKGKHIVLISGDEEYRSEEALPMLAQILAKRAGFTCTVLFSLDPESGEIDPNQQANIPGLQALETADLMVIFTRFRELPPEQMRYIDDYLMAGKPVIGLRTATHAFHYAKHQEDQYAKYDFQSSVPGWEKGFGKIVLGETWVSHHGDHGSEGTRAVINDAHATHPVLKGVTDIWGPTDVYTVGALNDATILLYGQSTSGMTADAPVNTEKEMLPIAWTRAYQLPGGNPGKAFATTMGASVDLQSADLRRLLVNASFWATGLEIPRQVDVSTVSTYAPTMFGFDDFKRGQFPADFRMKTD
ncbi:ThuA domain-containing protein [Parapedobacter sp. 10938]|uniref:ThuA domain-containing protein n=1 Tax=Parapedobacter flavus TaxID=3110225 RepID=UPI002DB79367|nr:ThuA domain-containing protein [Parapedobacter sp. 10938]MEC3879032.1 ThuA domain-containing protein [Parapedobacter sp. 10938]